MLSDFAILAPVPEVHLLAGLKIANNGDFIAYGTMKWELLRKIDKKRGGARVPVLIYPSHENLPGQDRFVVSWFGWYIGHVDSKHGAHPQGEAHRPLSTFDHPADNEGHWAVFWHLEGLRQLPPEQRMTIGQIEGCKGGWRKNAPPRGPELVKLPSIYEDED
jgi:hypothetical protein